MANIPIKWGKVGTDGKAEVNGEDNSTFSSSSPAFKVNGDEEITGDSSIGGSQSITGDSSVGGDQSITGDGSIGGDGTVSGNLIVTGNGSIGGNGTIGGNLIVNDANTTNKVGINVASPSEVLEVSGNIKASGNLMSSGGDLSLGTTGSGSDDSGDIVWKYGNGNEKARIWADNTYTTAKGLNYRLYKSDGTQLMSGTIPTSDTNTTYTIATGDSNGQIKVTPSSGSAYNVGVKGLGSAAYKNYAEANTASTVVARNANGYIYGTYYNASCGNETTNYDSTTGFNIYCNSDGWLRKAKAVTQLYSGSLAPTGQCTWANYKAYSKYIVFVSVDGTANLCTGIIPRDLFTSSRSANSSYVISNEVNWSIVYLYYSGTTGYAYLEAGASSARVKYIFGLN